jgi:two-component system cell cycle response regulator
MKILIADDDALARHLLEAFLVKWGYEVMAAAAGGEAWQLLQQPDTPRLAILDWMMPEMDGVQICREIRRRKGQPYTYVLLLTAKGQKQDIVEGLEAGADDYLTKPFDPYELRARLRAGRRIVELQEQLISARDAFRDQATHDPLTGVWNRRAILGFLSQGLDRAARDGTFVSVVMADVDHFKAVNDTYGHLAGDTILREVTRRMGSAIRTYDALGRYGGDEFVAVIPGCDAAEATRVAERFRTRIDQKAMDTSEGMIPVTLSVGVAVGGRTPKLDPEALLRAADVALYRAKIAGRNGVGVAQPGEISGKACTVPPEPADRGVEAPELGQSGSAPPPSSPTHP